MDMAEIINQAEAPVALRAATNHRLTSEKGAHHAGESWHTRREHWQTARYASQVRSVKRNKTYKHPDMAMTFKSAIWRRYVDLPDILNGNDGIRGASQNVRIRQPHFAPCIKRNDDEPPALYKCEFNETHPIINKSATHIYVSFAMQTSSPIHLAKIGCRPPLIYKCKIEIIGVVCCNI